MINKSKALFLCAAVWALLPGARAATLSDPAVDHYNCRMTTTLMCPGYCISASIRLVMSLAS